MESVIEKGLTWKIYRRNDYEAFIYQELSQTVILFYVNEISQHCSRGPKQEDPSGEGARGKFCGEFCLRF